MSFAVVFVKLFARLPLPVTHALGIVIGWLFVLLPNPHRTITRANLKACYPELSRRQRWRLQRRSLLETGKAVFETPRILAGSNQTVMGMVKQVHNRELLDEAVKQGQGVALAMPHLGNWEILALYCSSLYPMTTLYRPPRMASMDELLRQGRERLGANLVPTGPKGVRALYQALGRGGLIAILPDQDPREAGGHFAPFYGIAANTMTLLPRLLHKSQAPTVFCYAERLPWGRGFAIHFEKAPEGMNSEDMDVAVGALNQGVENCVRALPGQYQWSYKRFRTRPEGEADMY